MNPGNPLYQVYLVFTEILVLGMLHKYLLTNTIYAQVIMVPAIVVKGTVLSIFVKDSIFI